LRAMPERSFQLRAIGRIFSRRQKVHESFPLSWMLSYVLLQHAEHC
jgi:hypothetical protein